MEVMTRIHICVKNVDGTPKPEGGGLKSNVHCGWARSSPPHLDRRLGVWKILPVVVYSSVSW
jgi:hypothetical protein